MDIVDIALKLVSWLVVGAFGLFVLFLIAGLAFLFVAKATLIGAHYATRDTPPKKGQAWRGFGDRPIRVEDVAPDGVIRLNSGSSTWWETPANWKLRVRAERLYLMP